MPHPHLARAVPFSLPLLLVGIWACASPRPDPASDPVGSSVAVTTHADASSAVTSHGDTGDAASSAAVDDGGAATIPDASRADAETDAGACLGDEPGPPAACPADGPCAGWCQAIVARYRPGVGRAAAACIAALPSCTEAVDVIPCVDQAIARACPADEAATACADLVPRCDPNADQPPVPSAISTAGCRALVSALGAGGRATFSSCLEDAIADGTCAAAAVGCADEARF